MDDFLFFLITVGFPIIGLTVVLTSYIMGRYKERRLLIEQGKELLSKSPILPFSRVSLLQVGILSVGISFGMFTGIFLMELLPNTIIGQDEGIAWGITVPLFVGLSLIASSFVKKDK